MSNRSQQPAEQPKQKWYKQVAETYRIAKGHTSNLGLKLFGIFVGVFAITIALGYATGNLAFFGILAFGLAILVTLFIFGRIAERAIFATVEGQLGAAASVLQSMPPRSGFTTTPAVGVDKNQNMVHRVVGRCGVILVGEGPRPGVLLAEQKKLHARVAPGVPVHDLIAGDNGIALRKLRQEVKKFKKVLRPAEATELRRRFSAMPTNPIPIPKGPMPTRGKIPRR